MAVEKLLVAKIAKIKSRQDAIWAIFSDFLDIFYPQFLAVWDEKGVFQQPRLIATITWSLSVRPSLFLVGIALARMVKTQNRSDGGSAGHWRPLPPACASRVNSTLGTTLSNLTQY